MAPPLASFGDLPSAAETRAASLEAGDNADPRVRRTRKILHQALAELLHTREFDKLSVQEITDVAGVNRATFYAHYPDKFALLECMIADRFQSLIAERGVVFDGSCDAALQGIALGVCDFLTQSLRQGGGAASPRAGQLPPHMESAIIAVVRRMLLEGIRKNPPQGVYSPELLASTASWAIYGAAREWLQTPNHPPSEQAAPAIQRLVTPILHPQG
ncbi:MAG: TetR/AcrR family transcriptional regulator [Acidobacteriaceae bacterium]